MQEIVLTDTWRDRVEDVISRARENRSLLLVVAAVAGISLLLWARGPTARVAPPARASSPAVTTSGSPAATVVVHVAGAVRRPGLYRFPYGARIADAIETAAGTAPRADLDALNLAEVLVDGTQIVVPRRDSSLAGAPAASLAPASSPALVPLNSADIAALETIPGIGPVTAQAIVDHRSQIGAFASVDELLDVDGIGPATLESIKPYLSL